MTQMVDNPIGYPWHADELHHVQQQLLAGRMPHAVMYRHRPFYYDESLAQRIAQLLLCDSTNGQDNCQHCRLISENTHPNVVLLNVREEKVGIAEVRDLEQQMWQTAMFDKPKIAIIDGIDLLSNGAQNALLKTLEEPPKNAFFILSVNVLSNVLATIISRVQRLHHRPQTTEEQDHVVHWLQQQLGKAAPTEAEIVSTAKLARFAPQAALALLQSPEQVAELNAEKSRFAQFISGRCQALTFVEAIDKDHVGEQLTRYNHYLETLIHSVFDKMAHQGNNPPNERTVIRWQGVSLQGLYRLRDTLTRLQRLNRSNVNMTMQLQTDLMDWQNDRTN